MVRLLFFSDYELLTVVGMEKEMLWSKSFCIAILTIVQPTANDSRHSVGL